MGVYIKGMEMPKSCLACQLERHQDTAYDYEFRCCPVTGEMTNHYRNERAPRCPLVLVPPHGRLIDADALLKKCEFVCTDDDEDTRAVRYSIIEDAPTIIPESEEGET